MKTIDVVAAVIRVGNRVLATQRGYGEWRGSWEFPGGKTEPGESPSQALVREIREELCLHIHVGRLLRTIEYDYPTFHLRMHCYLCEMAGGRLTLEEHEAALWVGADDLEKLDWLPADRELLPELRACLAHES
ncbi:MAG TPA: (deoxy)nucleoside triphosphate pyrophosphohydrolase [Candidatus Akkermansia intestinigallinarum]|uniref:8-oxo-dGTP diphosphatase n=1 Tax=Candidatus Akkermansia intestinigallinarum TaxID=2838431 RepID=A0A9D2AGA6_9BACT|nr:(deoxy)nucleoside triphosphate pyrophosphohydrolase [Candidatus Akkermansia intestinigallinarum]